MFDRDFYEREHKEICAWYQEKYANRDSYLIFDVLPILKIIQVSCSC